MHRTFEKLYHIHIYTYKYTHAHTHTYTHTWPHHVDFAGGEEAAGAEMEIILVPTFAEDSVSCVFAAVDARHDLHLRVAGDGVDCLALGRKFETVSALVYLLYKVTINGTFQIFCLSLVSKVGAGHEDALAGLDQWEKHLLHRRFRVPARGCVVELRDAFDVLYACVYCLPLFDQLLVLALVALEALQEEARRGLVLELPQGGFSQRPCRHYVARLCPQPRREPPPMMCLDHRPLRSQPLPFSLLHLLLRTWFPFVRGGRGRE
jgi:hypothetical protein